MIEILRDQTTKLETKIVCVLSIC